MKNEESHICRRCGRKLRDPRYKELGMGPVCYQKWLEANRAPKLIKVSSLQSSDKGV